MRPKLLSLFWWGIGVLFASVNTYSAPVSENVAKNVAFNFISEMNVRVDMNSISLVYTSEINSQNLFYVFDYKNGWVIVSADDRIIPVLAYSTEGAFLLPEVNDSTGNNFWGWMREYESQIKYIADNNISASTEVQNKWDVLTNSHSSSKSMMSPLTVVNPLLTTSWNQDWPYNSMCPSDAFGPGGHVYAGCVATAMAQIMKYHNWPSQGLGSYGYTWGSYPQTTANFGATTYNWANMPNSISTVNNDVATIIYHCAVANRSMWGPASTGVGYSSDQDPMSRAFVNYFKMAFSSIEYIQKLNYTSAQWDSILQSELTNNRPVYYRGDGSLSHAWVCDGVDASNMYHFNWGWGGMYNGYFALSNLNPGGNNLTNNQSAIIGIKPNDGSTLVVNTTWSGSITKTTHVAVPDAITLTVNPGTVVSFEENCKLQIFGRIVSIGNPNSYAKFTAVDTVLGWSGIKFDNGYMLGEVMADNDSSSFIYSQIEWSKNSGLYCNAYGKVIVDHCKVNDNSSNGSGGGISIWQHPINITNSDIYNNHATSRGGGFFVNYTDTLIAKISQNDIYNNVSDIDGGGFCLYVTPKIIFENNIINENQAIKGAGGALIGSSPSLINNKFTNNIASSSGGGLYLENCSAIIVNNLIANNISGTSYSGAGGGVSVTSGSNPGIFNNTIVNNSSHKGGGMVFAVNANANTKNCIIYGNYAISYGSQVGLVQSDCDPLFDHCNIQGGMAGFGGPGAGGNYSSSNYTNNIDSNPLFVSPTSGAGSGYNGLLADWSLQSTSPCIDAGDTTGISQYLPIVDLAGNNRISGIIDIGGYEYSAFRQLQLNLYLQGIYQGSGQMRPCTGSQLGPGVADVVSISLHEAGNFQAVVFSEENINLSTGGQANVLLPLSLTGSYYLRVAHRNSIGVASALPITLTGNSVQYDFRQSAGMAYGANQCSLGSGFYGLYTGDVDGDGAVTPADVQQITATAQGFVTGYVPADLNGDGLVDALDLVLADNNAAQQVVEVAP